MSKCPVFDQSCSVHGFYHGAEAEELREGIEKVIKLSSGIRSEQGVVRQLQELLDKVDARDSVAYLEAKKDEEKEPDEDPKREEPEEDYGTCEECGAEDQNLVEGLCDNCYDEE